MQNMWLTWAEINNALSKKRLYLYGRSEDWVHKALKKLLKIPDAIIDRDISYHGTNYCNLPVIPFEEVLDKKDIFVLITAGEYDGIVENLNSHGLKPGVDFSCSPDFRDYRVLADLRNYKNKVLVSSSDYNDCDRARSSRDGGGLYLYDLSTGEYDLKIRGSFRQLTSYKEGTCLVVDYVSKKLLQFDGKFSSEVVCSLDWPNYCGIDYNATYNIISVINAGRDEILFLDGDSLQILDKKSFRYSKKIMGGHHINDVVSDLEYIYISYFSFSGAFKRGVFDGGVAEIPLSSLTSEPEQIIGGLWKPHSPKYFDGSLFVLDSMRGRLVKGCDNVLARMPGFLRGLDYNGRYFLIGQSEDMYVTERMSNRETVMLNAGFYLFDNDFSCSRFYPMNGIMNVHDVKFWRE